MLNRPDIKRLPKRMNPLEAQRKLLAAFSAANMQIESVPLPDAIERVLAKDVFSNIDIPNYDKTFIDGYAIDPLRTRDASVKSPVNFRIVGKLFPVDYPPTVEVQGEEAVYVACGAPIPKGASATVKVEETRLNGAQIQVMREIKTGEGIIPKGDDVRKGALVLSKGQVLRPQDVGLLASLGLGKAEVFKKPTVTILSGGDELIRQRMEKPERIANNYALVVAGLASQLGASALPSGIMPDSMKEMKAKIGEALASSDIVITIGGSSVGVKDFVPDAVNSIGKPGVAVQGVSLRPGAVSGFGVVDTKPIIMLPGHIGSCIAGFYLFAAPLISRFVGQEDTVALPRVAAELTEEVTSGPQFRFLLLRLKTVEGKLLAEPVQGGSSALTTIVKSNGYTIIAPHVKMAENSKVEVTLFDRLELSALQS